MDLLDLLQPVEPTPEDKFLAAARAVLVAETPEQEAQATQRARLAAVGLDPARVRELVKVAGRQARRGP